MERYSGFQQSLIQMKERIEKRMGQFIEYPGSKNNNEWYLASWIEARLIPSEQPKVEEKTKK